MMEKEKFQDAILEWIRFSDDVITASTFSTDGTYTPPSSSGGWGWNDDPYGV